VTVMALIGETPAAPRAPQETLKDVVHLIQAYSQCGPLRRVALLYLATADDRYLDRLRDIPSAAQFVQWLMKSPVERL
jgi:hypothetical protein